MCTLIVRHGMDRFCSTLIAANRDEFYDRPASGPQVLVESPHVVGGRDERAGGTWLAFTGDGLFLGLTNQRSFGRHDDTLRSRGKLVIEALRTASYDGVERYLRDLDARDYNEFNVLFGDGTRVCAAYGRSSSSDVELEPLGPGVHVLCNDRLGSDAFPKANEARVRVESISADGWSQIAPQLIDVLSDRSLPDPSALPPLPPDAPFGADVARRLQALCVETPVYGTVSATLAALSPGRVEHYAYCDAAPDRASFHDFTHLAVDA